MESKDLTVQALRRGRVLKPWRGYGSSIFLEFKGCSLNFMWPSFWSIKYDGKICNWNSKWQRMDKVIRKLTHTTVTKVGIGEKNNLFCKFSNNYILECNNKSASAGWIFSDKKQRLEFMKGKVEKHKPFRSVRKK